jgi:3-hydroxyisobutyrate dehydrogenase
MKEDTIGFIGLGNMGAPMAANLADAGWSLLTHDAAGSRQRSPRQARVAESIADVAAEASVVLLSLPDNAAVEAVGEGITGAPSRRTKRVVDTSTIGIAQARRIHAKLAGAGIEYVDAPVSGGVAGARAGSVSIMVSGPAASFEALRPLLEGFSGNIFHVGLEPGQGQAMKVLNNFLSGTAMAATSEAVAFGASQGLELSTMLDVLNVSTGRNTATSDKFVNRILTESYDAGFSCAQMNKDLKLYREGLAASGGADPVSGAVADVWQRFLEASADADITRIYPFIKSGFIKNGG